MRQTLVMIACLSMLLFAGSTSIVLSSEKTASVSEPPLILGVFPRRSATTTTHLFTPLANYLSESLGREVVLETSKDFASFWQNVEKKKYDIVHYNQYHYIKSSADYEIFAQNEEFGNQTVSGALFVRDDSDITSIDQLKGKKIIFGGGKNAMMSYIVPRYLLQQSGLHSGDYDILIATNPPNSILAVYFREADAAGAGDRVPYLPVIADKIDTASIRILKASKPLPHLPWVMRKSLHNDLKKKIRKVMYELNETLAGKEILTSAGLTALHSAKDEDYDVHRDIVNALEPD